MKRFAANFALDFCLMIAFLLAFRAVLVGPLWTGYAAASIAVSVWLGASILEQVKVKEGTARLTNKQGQTLEVSDDALTGACGVDGHAAVSEMAAGPRGVSQGVSRVSFAPNYPQAGIKPGHAPVKASVLPFPSDSWARR